MKRPMATGVRCLILTGALAAQFSLVAAQEKSVTPIALFNGKAMISVDGAKAKIIAVGKSYKGVTVISSTTDEAIVEVEGQRQVLTLNGGTVLSGSLAAAPASSHRESVTLYENDQGFYESNGKINGRNLRFLIDTGANLVVLSSNQADRIGLEYQDGTRTYAVTASGTAPMFAITLDKISIGGIVLNNIRAGIIEGQFPAKPLLGMTFLSKLDMNRSGKTMVLKHR